MPKRKIPHDALSYYVSLGPARSYAQVAEHFGVTKRAIVKRATAEHWQSEVEEIERKAREKSKAKAGESLEEMNERHLKIARVVQSKALEALTAVSHDLLEFRARNSAILPPRHDFGNGESPGGPAPRTASYLPRRPRIRIIGSWPPLTRVVATTTGSGG